MKKEISTNIINNKEMNKEEQLSYKPIQLQTQMVMFNQNKLTQQ